ncbi:effector-associated constant component EACC1 [Paractinoplanes durhamensis]|uniref:Uncharacterized protein n=1 Tax=Paractinoplanes durhamensis TaxID=113563 RepID=A0ABQ3ZB00_9ACTN|nr:hypothetical protein [Actinoplanes durhamensis]GIE06991.1 hypothetical protein Adu01nite_83410 [Actinoplanes durhamensis]
MTVIVTFAAQTGLSELRSLHAYLGTFDALDGRLELRAMADSDHLGGVADAIAVAVGAGGAITVLAGAVTGWLDRRGRTLRVRLANDRTGRSVELSGVQMREASAAEVQALVRDMTRVLADLPPEAPIEP